MVMVIVSYSMFGMVTMDAIAVIELFVLIIKVVGGYLVGVLEDSVALSLVFLVNILDKLFRVLVVRGRVLVLGQNTSSTLATLFVVVHHIVLATFLASEEGWSLFNILIVLVESFMQVLVLGFAITVGLVIVVIISMSALVVLNILSASPVSTALLSAVSIRVNSSSSSIGIVVGVSVS